MNPGSYNVKLCGPTERLITGAIWDESLEPVGDGLNGWTRNLAIAPVKWVFWIIEVKIEREPQRTSTIDATSPPIN